MRNYFKRWAVVIVGVVCCCGWGGTATAISVSDGTLADWGVSTGDGNTSTYAIGGGPPLSLVPDVSLLGIANVDSTASGYGGAGTFASSDAQGSFNGAFMVEDTNDNSNAYHLGPYSGGQNYDGEFLGVAVQNDLLFIGVQSGERRSNGHGLYSPGDIRLSFSNGGSTVQFAIEVGGGEGGIAEEIITEGSPGSRYTLDGSGFTTGHFLGGAYAAGSVVLDPVLLPSGQGGETTQISDGTGTLLGLADYAFDTGGNGTAEHSVIELAVPLSLFAPAVGLGPATVEVTYQPANGNDLLVVSQSGITVVPEPGAAGLAMLLGMVLVGWRRR